MDPVLAITMILGILVPFVTSTVKNPASIAKLKKSLPAINVAIDALIKLRDAIEAKAKKPKK